MNQRLALGFIFWVILAGSAGADPGFQPRFEAGPIFLGGVVYELVLRDGTYNNPVSQLTWPIVPSLGFGLSAAFPWLPWTDTKVEFQGSFPLMVGSTTDDDWNTSNGLIRGHSTSDEYMTSRWTASLEEGFTWNDFRFSVG